MKNEIIQSQIGQLDITYSKLPFKLSWTHYQILMRIEDKDERDFYEKEAIRSGWDVSTLKRQYHLSWQMREGIGFAGLFCCTSGHPPGTH